MATCLRACQGLTIGATKLSLYSAGKTKTCRAPLQQDLVGSRKLSIVAATKPAQKVSASEARKERLIRNGMEASPATPGERQSLVQRVTDPLAGRPYRQKQPGDEPDFWEGAALDPLGFVLEYLWAIGIFVAIVGCIYAVKTYNAGADDFRETPAFKEASELLEEAAPAPPASTSAAQPLLDDAPPL
eukprot:jgi/Mesen1/4493/ME000229S03513